MGGGWNQEEIRAHFYLLVGHLLRLAPFVLRKQKIQYIYNLMNNIHNLMWYSIALFVVYLWFSSFDYRVTTNFQKLNLSTINSKQLDGILQVSYV